MNADRLLALYERVAEAPDAIARLRRFVLDLAVRGELVTQDPADEPASLLLKRIEAEKARLVQAGKIRKPRDLSGGDELAPLFDIPPSWRWCRLDAVGAIIGGGTPSAADPFNFAEPGEGIPWLTPADLGGYRDLYIERGARDLTEKGLSSSSATMMNAGTVLFTSRAPIGYVAIAANPIATNQGFKSIVPYVADCSRFIALTMQTFAREIDASAPGTTFKEVSGKIVAGVPFPLPPLAEQRRIVAKVDDLMALLDRLEEARTAREATRDRLTAASLARLTAPDTTIEDFPTHAYFALDALPALTTRADQIKPLRQTILDLAVRGKLVEQDPADEPASELLARISEHRIHKRKFAQLTPDEYETELPILPFGWLWTVVDQIAADDSRAITDGPFGSQLKTAHYKEQTGFRVIRLQNISAGGFRDEHRSYIDEKRFNTLSNHHVFPGDLVVAGLVDPNVRCCEVPASIGQALVKADCYRFSVHPDLFHRFALHYLNSPLAQEFASAHHHGMTLTRIGLGNFRRLPFPLPPLAEQHRIVAKVDALIALCDRLEAALATANTTRARLLEAVLHEALTPAESELAAA